MHKILLLIVLLPVAAFSSSSLSQDSSQETEEATETETTTEDALIVPYEIVVRANPSRAYIRGLIVEVEDDFVERFNELNDDDAFDIQCYRHRPTDSFIRQRVCEPNFFDTRRNYNVSESAYILSQTQNPRRFDQIEVMTPIMLRNDTRVEYEILEAKLHEFLEADPELQSMGNVLFQLNNRLRNYGKED